MEQSVIFALLLSSLAGISTVIGASIVFISKGTSKKTITFALGFAGGVMTCVSFTDLFPFAEKTLVKYYGSLYGVL